MKENQTSPFSKISPGSTAQSTPNLVYSCLSRLNITVKKECVVLREEKLSRTIRWQVQTKLTSHTKYTVV